MTHILGLGYLRAQTADLERWREFALEVVGFAEGSGPEADALHLRMDERRARLVLKPGADDRALAIGWEVADQFALQAVRDEVKATGIEVSDVPDDVLEIRGVEEAIAFTCPGGHPTEVFHSPILDHSPLITRHANRFVTDDQGMGHVVLPTTDVDTSLDFYTRVLGFRPRGAITMGRGAKVRFLGVNPRHHSLALVPAPHGEAPGLVHLMVEVDSLDSVGRALDQVQAHGFSLSSTLGRHTNDKMVSFYVRAPGGWDIEVGTDGLRVDQATYRAEEITSDSYWGHDWSGSEPLAAFVSPESKA
jgi:3,4-dihydroxy-9,10-secoandrosta-1,3,5(10)-triene-9,17-dione 4,5-dioxygenase